MPSASLSRFKLRHARAKIFRNFSSYSSIVTSDRAFIEQTCFEASIAASVGCWEGYVEAALREFVSKVRVQSHRRIWTLIIQFEAMVDKRVSDLNTPNWEKTRTLINEITGMDPFSSWIWSPKFSNPNDTKNFFDGIVNVRHAFAHGFQIPSTIPGLLSPGVLDGAYIDDAIACVEFFAEKTDSLLEHELVHRHGCSSGWS